jgi:hypothetical protein
MEHPPSTMAQFHHHHYHHPSSCLATAPSALAVARGACIPHGQPLIPNVSASPRPSPSLCCLTRRNLPASRQHSMARSCGLAGLVGPTPHLISPHLTSPRLGRPWQRPASFPTASPEEPWPGCYLYSVHAACLRSVVCAVVRAWRLGSWGRSIYGRVWFAPAECCALNGRWLVVTLLAVGKAEGSLEPAKLLLLQQQQQRCCIALRDGPVSVDATHQLLVSSAYRRCGKSWPCTLVQLPCIRTADWQRRRIGGQCATNASDRDGCAPNDCVDFYECPRLLLEAVPRP